MNSKIVTLLLLACAPACGAETTTGGKTNWLAGEDPASPLKPAPRPTLERPGDGGTSPESAPSPAAESNDAATDTGVGMSGAVSGAVSGTASGTAATASANAPDPKPEMNGSDGAAPDAADAAPPDESMGTPEPLGCDSHWFSPLAGRPAWQPEECAAVSETTRQAHDAALTAPVLQVGVLAGTWKVGSGASRIELALDAAGSGTLRFGDASDYPTASASDETFLSSTGERDANAIYGFELRPQIGFPYSVVSELGGGSELSFHILAAEAWDPWCKLQEPVISMYAPECYAFEEIHETYSVFPASSCGEEQAGCYAGKEPNEAARVHCGRLQLSAVSYSDVCACTAETCFANLAKADQLNLYPYQLQLDPVDSTILRLRSLSELQEQTTRYLTKVVAD